MAEEIKKKGNQINIELSEEISEGTYSNLAIISHSNSEFVLDFVRIVPNVQKAKVKSRIILSPEHAKRLHKALADNINNCLLYTSPSPRDRQKSRMPSSA